jgi:hypothetical protein
MSEDNTMKVVDEWTNAACRMLKIDPEVLDTHLLLELTKEVAHEVARPAAPITTFLAGLAAGQAGGDGPAIRQAVQKMTALVEQWPDRPGA